MKFPYDFGISQDDPLVESHGLNLENNRLLCIASGGEVPLSLLAMHNAQVTAVDTSINQIRLCRIKLASIINLEPYEAAILFGFSKDIKARRALYFSKLVPYLPPEDVDFWKQHAITQGIVHLSRFEKYIAIFCKVIRNILGSRKIRQFMEMESIDEQERYFDQHLHKILIRWIFKIAFSPLLYKNQGLDEKALMHQKGNNLPDYFYSKFRNFFTATPAKHNFYLQLYLMGEVIYKEALPLYLHPFGIENIIKRSPQLNFQVNSIFDLVEESEELKFENYALSNISDWCEEIMMDRLLLNIFNKSKDSVDIVIRYIHKNPINDFTNHIGFKRDSLFAKAMISIDRFPFYSLLKVNSKKSADG